MVSIEELKQKFGPVRDVAPYGPCIIVPGSEFNPDWEAELDDQSVKVFLASLDQRPVTLVQVKKPVGVMTPNEERAPGRTEKQREPKRDIAKVARHEKYGDDWRPEEDALLIRLHSEERLPYYKISEQMHEKFPARTEHAVFFRIYALMQQGKLQRRFERRKQTGQKKESKAPAVSPASGAKGPIGPILQPADYTRWTDAENELLIGLWNKKLNASQMLAMFPGRNENSIKMRLARLKEKGLIKPRWRQGKTKHDKELKGPEGLEPASTPVHTQTHTPETSRKEQPAIEAPGPVKDPMLSVLEEIRNLLGKQAESEAVSFEAYCRTCRQPMNVSNQKEVWRVCPRCGEPLIVWNVEVQEASE